MRRARARGAEDLGDWLSGGEWRGEPLPRAVADHPSMISHEERVLLLALAARCSGEGEIVDAGSFLGGSTRALATGLARNPAALDRGRRVHSYDRFVLDDWTKTLYGEVVGELEVGASLRPRFIELLGDLGRLVAVHEGDVRSLRWSEGDAIEVLFVDIGKSWEINDHVVREFFPALLPGRSVLIQQDFFHEWLPHIHVTMGLLNDAFRYAGSAGGSAMFVPTRRIIASEVPASSRTALADDEKLDLFDLACARFTGRERAILDCARAVLLSELGRHDEAIAWLDTRPGALADEIGRAVREVRETVRQRSPDPLVVDAARRELVAARALGDAIRAERERQGLGRGELAERASIHPDWLLSHVEAGSEAPDWRALGRIADALGISVAELARRAEQLAASDAADPPPRSP